MAASHRFACLRSCVLGAMLALLGSPALFAQYAELYVSGPRTVYELQPSFDFSIGAGGIYALRPALRILADDADITSAVSIVADEEILEDAEGDGVLEDYSCRFGVYFERFDPAPGQILRILASADSPTGRVRAQGVVEVLSHVDVGISGVVHAGATRQHVYVLLSEIRWASEALTVLLDDVDVTQRVRISGPELADESVEAGTPPIVRHRVERYWLDLAALGSGARGRLTVSLTVTDDRGGTSSDSGSANVVAPSGGMDECHKAAVKALCDALKLSKSASGAVSIGATPEEAKQAVDNFQNSLTACRRPFPGTPQQYDYAGSNGTLEVVISANANGRDATAKESGDLVIAIAGDGSGSGDGGDAVATNTQAGGAALAQGGDGGSGASSAGDGGNATAQGTGAGQAFAVGGNGGCPLTATKAGGNGGTASGSIPPGHQAQSAGTSGSPGGTPPGTPGKHGGGGWVQQNAGAGKNGQLGPYANA